MNRLLHSKRASRCTTKDLLSLITYCAFSDNCFANHIMFNESSDLSSAMTNFGHSTDLYPHEQLWTIPETDEDMKNHDVETIAPYSGASQPR